MPGSVTRSNSGVPRGGKCGVERVGPIVSVEEVMGTELSRLRPVYEGGVGPRLEDSGVSNVEGVATLSQEQDRACPSQSEHGYSTRRQAEGLNKCIAAWRYLSSVSDTDRVAATRALQLVANALLLFLPEHEYQFDCMMKLERVFSGQCLNHSRIQDWFGSEKHFPEIAQLVCLAESGVAVRVASGGDLAFALRYSNHSSADGFVDDFTDKIRDDVRFGCAFVFPREAAACLPGVRVSPLAVIKSSTKLSVVHDFIVLERPVNDKRQRRHRVFVGS